MHMIVEIIGILAIFVIPVLLLYYNRIPVRFRIHTLAFLTVVTFVTILIDGIKFEYIGIRLDTIPEYAIPYLIFTAILAIILVSLAKLSARNDPKKFGVKDPIYIALLSSVSQEFMFRGYLFLKLGTLISNPYIVILINSLLFAFIHIIYSNNIWTFIMIFLAGILFTTIYWIYPNLILLMISHAVLNYIAVSYGFYREIRKGSRQTEEISFDV